MDFEGFIGASYESQSPLADQEDTINWYVEIMESQDATRKRALYPTPGVDELSSAVVSPGRAHFFMDDREFAVIGTSFIEIDSNGAQTVRGTVALDDNPATINSNGAGGGELFITSGTNGYIFTLATNTLSQIAALNGKATMGGHLDGYFLALDAATATLYISDLLDGTTWDPTQFAQRTIAPDPWIAMRVNGRYVWLFGEQTSEVWYNTGASPFPFAPYPGVLVQYGIAAPFSTAIIGKDILWLGRSSEGQGRILRAPGFTPEVISNYPIQTAIDGYADVDKAIADSYTDKGHSFYLLSFDRAKVTWAWDAETGLWCKRGTWDPEENTFTSWRPRYHAFAFNAHRMLDSNTGSLYHMDVSYTTDVDGVEIRRLRRAPALVNENKRVYYSELELDFQPGVGTGSGQGENPVAMLRCSNDSGRTWGTETMRELGALGEYSTRINWHRLGMARKRVFEVTLTDPVAARLVGAYVKIGKTAGGEA